MSPPPDLEPADYCFEGIHVPDYDDDHGDAHPSRPRLNGLQAREAAMVFLAAVAVVCVSVALFRWRRGHSALKAPPVVRC